jgi:hypothetical protein
MLSMVKSLEKYMDEWETLGEVADVVFGVNMMMGRTRMMLWNLDNRLERQDAMIKVCLQSR